MMSNKTYTVLVIDDDAPVRRIIARMMTGQGYVVYEAGSGLEGLVIAATQRVDLVLLDFEMPGLTGLEVLKTLRETHSKLGLPIILVTGRTDNEDVLSALRLGANDYVTKPIVEPIFKARVATQLSMKTESEGYKKPQEAATNMEAIGPGTILHTRYEILRKISSGGFGDIFEASQSSTGQRVAIKTIRIDLREASISQVVPRFETELRVLAQTSHPHIVKLLDSGRVANGNLYLVLEFIEGESLGSYISNRTRVPFHEAASLMRQVLDGLHCAHTIGVIHSDITPSNIMVSSQTLLPNAHILDFGVVHLAVNSNVTQSVDLNDSNLIVGTPQYMAPEQLVEGARTAQSDLFAWGLLFAECLLGHPLIPHIDPLAVHGHYESTEQPVSVGYFTHALVDQFFRKVLAAEPASRPKDAAAVLSGLDQLAKALPIEATASDYVNLAYSASFHKKHLARVEFGETLSGD